MTPVPDTRNELDARSEFVLDDPIGTRRVADAFPYLRKVTVSAEAACSIHLVDDLSVVPSTPDGLVGSHYNGNGSAPFDPLLHVPSCWVLDTTITQHSAGWDVVVHVNDSLNRSNDTSVYPLPFRLFTRSSLLPPRTFGVRETYR